MASRVQTDSFSTRTHPRLSETHRSLSKPRPRRQIILARAQARAAWKLIEALWRPGFGSKRIGTSTNLRRFEAHRGLPKNRPRKQNVLARARTRGVSRLIKACPRPGLSSKTHWHELTPRPPGPGVNKYYCWSPIPWLG